jgi:predicted DNA binding CopG/RHH family protein
MIQGVSWTGFREWWRTPVSGSEQMAEQETRTKVTIRLPVALVKRAKHYAVDQDTNLQDVIAEALQAFLARKGGR